MFNLVSHLTLPLLRRLDPERAHNLTLGALSLGLGPRAPRDQSDCGYEIFGKRLLSRVGFPGGLDKTGRGIAGLQKMGFGFGEVGTITYAARAGNPARPRLWRLRPTQSLVNFFGLNSPGFPAVLRRIEKFRRTARGREFCLGANLGTPDGKWVELLRMTVLLAPWVDYFVYNVSCPNVAAHGIADDKLAMYAQHIGVIKGRAQGKPVLVKLGPMMDEAMLLQLARMCLKAGADGFVVCNTVPPDDVELLDPEYRPNPWPTDATGKKVGGYSGPGLFKISRWMTKTLRKALGPEVTLIMVGGIMAPVGAMQVLETDEANLVQLYTALTYQGPGLLWQTNAAVARLKVPSKQGLRKAA